MNAKISVLVIGVEAIIYLLYYIICMTVPLKFWSVKNESLIFAITKNYKNNRKEKNENFKTTLYFLCIYLQVPLVYKYMKMTILFSVYYVQSTNKNFCLV